MSFQIFFVKFYLFFQIYVIVKHAGGQTGIISCFAMSPDGCYAAGSYTKSSKLVYLNSFKKPGVYKTLNQVSCLILKALDTNGYY